jgi:hypothetical protein
MREQIIQMKRIVVLIFLSVLWLSPLAGWGASSSDSWRSLTPKEKDKVLRNYQRWQNLPPQDKEHLREEWDRWQRLPQDRRDRLKQRYEERQGRDKR